VLDVKMPGIDGMEILKKVKEHNGDCVVVMLTAIDDVAIAVEAIEKGADSFLRKPVILPELTNAIDQALEKRRLKEESARYHMDLERQVNEKTAALHEAYTKIKDSNIEMAQAMAEVMEHKNPHLIGHCKRVAKLALAMGRELGLSREQLTALEYGAILHDIGMIGVNKEITAKPDELTGEEYEHIKQHPVLGKEIISRISFLKPAEEIVLRHHERCDGKGYPEGLGHDELDVLVLIILLADAYDAMTNDRPHRKGMPVERALEILEENKRTQFDPDLVDLFIKRKIYNTIG